jgi:hypothetical protein
MFETRQEKSLGKGYPSLESNQIQINGFKSQSSCFIESVFEGK